MDFLNEWSCSGSRASMLGIGNRLCESSLSMSVALLDAPFMRHTLTLLWDSWRWTITNVQHWLNQLLIVLLFTFAIIMWLQ